MIERFTHAEFGECTLPKLVEMLENSSWEQEKGKIRIFYSNLKHTEMFWGVNQGAAFEEHDSEFVSYPRFMPNAETLDQPPGGKLLADIFKDGSIPKEWIAALNAHASRLYAEHSSGDILVFNHESTYRPIIKTPTPEDLDELSERLQKKVVFESIPPVIDA